MRGRYGGVKHDSASDGLRGTRPARTGRLDRSDQNAAGGRSDLLPAKPSLPPTSPATKNDAAALL